MRLNNKHAVVTGAGNGIGRAIARRFAAEGASVACMDIDAEAAARTAAKIRDDGGTATPTALDITDFDAVTVAIEASAAAHGRLDILVNNAGTGLQKPFLETPVADFRRILDVNLTAAFHCAKVAVTAMLDCGTTAGRVINIASVAGQRGSVGRAAYGASKGGLINLTQVMAVELAERGITVNAIAPGPVETDLTRRMHTEETRRGYAIFIPQRRYGTVGEIAAAAAFLAADEAGYITGHVLDVDGGLHGSGMNFIPPE